jgi:Zn-dependent protease with chaperone function
LLIGTNLAIMLVLGIVCTLTGAHKFFSGAGLDLGKLLFFALIMGFGGAFISLWMSKTLAKWSTGAQVIESPGNSTEYWLFDTRAPILRKGGSADARGGDLRGRAECLRDWRQSQQFAGRRLYRPAAEHDAQPRRRQ